MIKAADGVIIIFGLIVLLSVILNKNKSISAFSKQTMDCLKGLFAIAVVLFHLSQHIDGGGSI